MANILSTSQPLGAGFTILTQNAGPIQFLVGIDAGPVASVFGRTGAVVAQTGDYSIAQIGGSGAASNNIPVWTGSAWAPQALSTLPAVTSLARGLAPQITGGAGLALISSGIAAAWGVDFAAQQLTTTGGYIASDVASFVRLGVPAGSGSGAQLSSASQGGIRLPRGGSALSQIWGRNLADSGDVLILEWSSGPGSISLGSPSASTPITVGNGLSISGGVNTLLASSGAVRFSWNTTGIGFYATSPVAKPTVTGSKGANAALTSLMSALSNLGLVTDSTS